jgi:hypothetical protein
MKRLTFHRIASSLHRFIAFCRPALLAGITMKKMEICGIPFIRPEYSNDNNLGSRHSHFSKESPGKSPISA